SRPLLRSPLPRSPSRKRCARWSTGIRSSASPSRRPTWRTPCAPPICVRVLHQPIRRRNHRNQAPDRSSRDPPVAPLASTRRRTAAGAGVRSVPAASAAGISRRVDHTARRTAVAAADRRHRGPARHPDLPGGLPLARPVQPHRHQIRARSRAGGDVRGARGAHHAHPRAGPVRRPGHGVPAPRVRHDRVLVPTPARTAALLRAARARRSGVRVRLGSGGLCGVPRRRGDRAARVGHGGGRVHGLAVARPGGVARADPAHGPDVLLDAAQRQRRADGPVRAEPAVRGVCAAVVLPRLVHRDELVPAVPVDAQHAAVAVHRPDPGAAGPGRSAVPAGLGGRPRAGLAAAVAPGVPARRGARRLTMWRRFTEAWSVAWQITALNFRAQLEYRVEFLIRIAFGVVWQLSIIVFAAVLLSKFSGMGGWTSSQILLLVATRMLCNGLYVLYCGSVFSLSFYVQQGLIDGYLLRPMPVFRQVQLVAFQTNGIGDLLVGIGLFVGAIARDPVDWTPGRVAYLAAGVIGGTLLITAVFTAVSAAA